MKYTAQKSFDHADLPAVGILVANLGTPEAPTATALRPYLRQFLSDPRVIEFPRLAWKLILELFVLPFRPRRSAEAYREVWTEEGSPLLEISKQQAAGIAGRLAEHVGNPFHVEVGMTYGEPSMGGALQALREKGCRRILVLPLYPQYSGTTTAPVFDAVARELMTWRWVPELRTINGWHDHPGYVAALAATLRETWSGEGVTGPPGHEKDRGHETGDDHDTGIEGRAERLIFSFHGIPQRYFTDGDPYHCLCHKTARLVAEELELEDGTWEVTFQSRFGPEEWLQPYTDKTIQAMAASGVKSLDVVCPGFSADCLETIEEIDGENREYFEEGGGEHYRYVPCLNAREDHLDLLTSVTLDHLAGWIAPPAGWSREEAEAEARATKRRADALAADPPAPDAGYGSGDA